MTTCQERVISRPQVGGRLDSMAPCGLFQLCDSDSCILNKMAPNNVNYEIGSCPSYPCHVTG